MPKVYSVYDKKLQEFGQLAVSKNDESMRRALYDGVKGSQSMIEKYPQDFDLYRVGEFDPQQGVLTGYTSPSILVCNVGDLLGGNEPLKVVRDA